MIDELPALDMPEWLSAILNDQNNVPYEIESILRDSFFYPGCLMDVNPIRWLVGNIFSFVYTDNGIDPEDYLKHFEGADGVEPVFDKYHWVFKKRINPLEVMPGGWPSNLMPERIEFFDVVENVRQKAKLFGHWSVWKRNEGLGADIGPEGFSLLYAFSEMSALYEGLYNGLSIAPKIHTIIEGGFVVEGPPPQDEDSVFKGVVTENVKGFPEYLIYGGHGEPQDYEESCWQEYHGERIVQFPERYAGLWKLNQ
jgi:hypothetical protein